MNYLRIIAFLFLIMSAVFLPLFFVLGLFVLAASFFTKFWEGVFVGIFLDSLYFSPVIFSKFNLGFFTLSFVASIFLLELFKNLVQGRNALSKVVVAIPGFLYFYFLSFLFS